MSRYNKIDLPKGENLEFNNKVSRPSFPVLEPGNWTLWYPKMVDELRCKEHMKWLDAEMPDYSLFVFSFFSLSVLPPPKHHTETTGIIPKGFKQPDTASVE
eukprot:TRINITY_DN7203_c0_g1_i1.p2 TRINITY_DN7203_c0_g1~~TRINITY_DN7203_c0_g1_i1.p2  ORF type:complete len:101 (+),score=15.41 TRINITY_DN7203_c0_g1_i1:258-560(+)